MHISFLFTFLRRIIIFFIFFIFSIVNAQDFHSSQFMLLPNINNPAIASYPDNRIVSLNYRNQWPDISANYNTYDLTYLHRIYSYRNGAGLKISNDVQGKNMINTFRFDGFFSQKINIRKDFTLDVGLGAAYSLQTINREALNFFVFEPVESFNLSCIDVSAGIIAEYKKYYAGVAVKNPASPFYIGKEIPKTASRKVTVHTGKVIERYTWGYRRESLSFHPQFMAEFQSGFYSMSYGCSTKSNFFVLGIWIRQNIKLNIESFILALGVSGANYDVIYSFDYNPPSSSLTLSDLGAHEITCMFRFENNKDHRNKRRLIF